MQSIARIGRIGAAAVAAALVVGLAAVSHPSAAQQADQSDKKQHDMNQGDKSGANPGAQAPATPPPTEAPAAAAATIVTATATVEKVDKAAGKLTLKDPQGKTFDLKPGPRVNLDQLKPGDRVTATYYEEVAVAINKAAPGAAPKMVETTVERAGGVTAKQATVTARIVSVDPKKNTVEIRTPDANTHSLKVQDPDLQARLKQIKPGDNLDITYTEALALSVEPKK
jgi:hypothetical protein